MRPTAPKEAAAVAWAILFGMLHVAWAAGSRILIDDPAAADAAFGRGWFQAYNLVVAIGSLVAAGVVVVSIRAPSARVRRWMTRVVWLAAGALAVRGGIGAMQLVWVTVADAADLPIRAWAVDLYMLAGGVLLYAATRPGRGRAQRRT